MQNEYFEGIKKDATAPTFRLDFDHSRLLDKTSSTERFVADHTLQVRMKGDVLKSADWRGSDSREKKPSNDTFACHRCRDAVSCNSGMIAVSMQNGQNSATVFTLVVEHLQTRLRVERRIQFAITLEDAKVEWKYQLRKQVYQGNLVWGIG